MRSKAGAPWFALRVKVLRSLPWFRHHRESSPAGEWRSASARSSCATSCSWTKKDRRGLGGSSRFDRLGLPPCRRKSLAPRARSGGWMRQAPAPPCLRASSQALESLTGFRPAAAKGYLARFFLPLVFFTTFFFEVFFLAAPVFLCDGLAKPTFFRSSLEPSSESLPSLGPGSLCRSSP